jgi:hypothetical protein
MKAQKEKCGARCPDQRGGEFICELRLGHKSKHDDPNGGTWNDDGAARLRLEQAEIARRAEIEREPF